MHRPSRLVFRTHALRRMFERRISVDDVRDVITNGETIEKYPDDTPYPSRLMLGWPTDRPLHVVVADNTQDNETIVITAYQPDAAQWEVGFKRRRRP
jgi:hypothetical protein